MIQKLLDEGFSPETLQKDKINQIGNIAEEKSFSNPQTGRIYSNNGICPTLNTCGGGNREVKIVEDSGERAQQLEPNTANTTNTLTSVLKDNYVLEKQGEPEQKIKVIGHYSESYRSAQVVSGGGISPTLRARDYKDPIRIIEDHKNE